MQGVKNEKGVWITPAFPKLIYVLDEDNIFEEFQILEAYRAGRPVHSKAHGAGLHFCKDYERVKAGGRISVHGLPLLPYC